MYDLDDDLFDEVDKRLNSPSYSHNGFINNSNNNYDLDDSLFDEVSKRLDHKDYRGDGRLYSDRMYKLPTYANPYNRRVKEFAKIRSYPRFLHYASDKGYGHPAAKAADALMSNNVQKLRALSDSDITELKISLDRAPNGPDKVAGRKFFENALGYIDEIRRTVRLKSPKKYKSPVRRIVPFNQYGQVRRPQGYVPPPMLPSPEPLSPASRALLLRDNRTLQSNSTTMPNGRRSRFKRSRSLRDYGRKIT